MLTLIFFLPFFIFVVVVLWRRRCVSLDGASGDRCSGRSSPEPGPCFLIIVGPTAWTKRTQTSFLQVAVLQLGPSLTNEIKSETWWLTGAITPWSVLACVCSNDFLKCLWLLSFFLSVTLNLSLSLTHTLPLSCSLFCLSFLFSHSCFLSGIHVFTLQDQNCRRYYTIVSENVITASSFTIIMIQYFENKWICDFSKGSFAWQAVSATCTRRPDQRATLEQHCRLFPWKGR